MNHDHSHNWIKALQMNSISGDICGALFTPATAVYITRTLTYLGLSNLVK